MSDHPVNQSTNRDSVGQSAELRTRLAAAIMESCHGLYLDDAVNAADAVIRELGMHREEMSEWAVLSEGFRGHRYVTHWEENDPSPVTKIRSAEKLGLTGDGE